MSESGKVSAARRHDRMVASATRKSLSHLSRVGEPGGVSTECQRMRMVSGGLVTMLLAPYLA